MIAVENLIRSHAQYHEDTSVGTIVARYNIPSEGLVESVISDIEM